MEKSNIRVKINDESAFIVPVDKLIDGVSDDPVRNKRVLDAFVNLVNMQDYEMNENNQLITALSSNIEGDQIEIMDIAQSEVFMPPEAKITSGIPKSLYVNK